MAKLADARDSKSRGGNTMSVRVRLPAPVISSRNAWLSQTSLNFLGRKRVHTDCIFCKIIEGILPAAVVWQDEDVMVIKDIHPKAPIHNLIIPKKHVSDLSALTAEDDVITHKIFVEVPKKLTELLPGAGAFNLVVNNGAAAGQIVFHLHVHFLAGKNLFKL